jgi:acylphosphatase
MAASTMVLAYAPMRKRIVVHGRVQGVGFRHTVWRAATARGVAGWVRNRADGTVEAAFEGDGEAVDAVIRLCREGPRGARVEQVESVEEEPEGLNGFSVR